MLNNIKHYIKNFSWLMLENILKILFGFLVSIYVIKYLGPKDFGLLSYLLSIIGIVTPFATLGTDAILFRNLIKNKEREKAFIQTTKTIRFLMSIFLSLLLFVIFYFYIDDKISKQIFAILLISLVLQSFTIYKEYFLAFEKVKYITFSSIISLVVTNLFRIFLIILKAKLIWFAVAYIIEKISNILSLRYFYKKVSIKDKQLFDKKIAKEMIKDSWPLMFTSFAGVLYLQADQILIKYYLDYEAVGIYATAVKLIMFLYIIPSIIGNIYYPKMIKYYQNYEHKDYEKKLFGIYMIVYILSILFIIIFHFFGDYLVYIVGEKYVKSLEILKLYSFVMIFMFFTQITNIVIMTENLQKMMLYRTYFGLLVNILTNIYLIPKYEIKGAVYSTLMSEMFVLLSYFFHKKTRFIFYLQIKTLFFITLLQLRRELR